MASRGQKKHTDSLCLPPCLHTTTGVQHRATTSKAYSVWSSNCPQSCISAEKEVERERERERKNTIRAHHSKSLSTWCKNRSVVWNETCVGIGLRLSVAWLFGLKKSSHLCVRGWPGAVIFYSRLWGWKKHRCAILAVALPHMWSLYWERSLHCPAISLCLVSFYPTTSKSRWKRNNSKTLTSPFPEAQSNFSVFCYFNAMRWFILLFCLLSEQPI